MATNRGTQRGGGGGGNQAFFLEIPLDASQVVDASEGEVKYKPETPIKVVVQLADGTFHEQVTRLDAKGQGRVAFEFPRNPGSLHVMVGPSDANSEEISHLQTLSFELSTRQWAGKNRLSLRPVAISPYYWFWWLRWCRTFTIRGKVICPDGSPVPGAKVCAYDVDWWFLWSSTQQVGCATTDINGNFSITFRWCCGWWPWWWWRLRAWQLDPTLVDRVNPVLEKIPLPEPPVLTNQPNLALFNRLLGSQQPHTAQALTAHNVSVLESLREPLLKNMPVSSELERLRVWPWWPWWPWWDCTPDIIFKVTQDCITPGNVILNETVANTRWDIPNPLNVTLVASPNACCRPICPEPPCEGGDCLIIDGVCGIPVDQIGGNLSAPALPAGYAYPGAVIPGTATYNGDRPFAETITITKNPGDLIGVDYYEVEYFDGLIWNPLPAGAPENFSRDYWDTASSSVGWAGFPAINTFPGHVVYETREHYEATSGLTWDFPGADRWWLSYNYSTLLPIDTTKFPDGTYSFRIVGWNVSGANLTNRRVIPICGTEKDNNLILTFDNRVITPVGHPPSHNCGTLHVCTLEPDTEITAIYVNGKLVSACDTVTDTTGTVDIYFSVTDPDRHLAYYALNAIYGVNTTIDLLHQVSSSLTPVSMGTQVGPTYGEALGQGAVAPVWGGGSFKLTLSLSDAFPKPCCYAIELLAYKRTIASCDGDFAYYNRSDTTIGIGVCGTPVIG